MTTLKSVKCVPMDVKECVACNTGRGDGAMAHDECDLRRKTSTMGQQRAEKPGITTDIHPRRSYLRMNLSSYCDRVRWINDPVAEQQHIAGYCINQVFFVACLVKCILHLRRLRSHAAREGNFSRQGRTRAIVSALCACLCGIAYSTVIFAYKLVLINEENGTPQRSHDYMRWSYRTLQTFTLCL